VSAYPEIIGGRAGLTGFIDTDEALKRVMGNKKLLIRLLANFEGKEMADKVLEAVRSEDSAGIAYEAHKMRGVAANLGLVGLESALRSIEDCARAGQDVMEYVPALDAAVDETMRLIGEIVGEA